MLSLNSLWRYPLPVCLSFAAIKCYLKSKPIHKEIGNLNAWAHDLNNLGYEYVTKKEYEKAKVIFFKALDKFMQNSNRQGEGIAKGNLGIAFM